jgi:hypothetical protein
MKTPMILLGCLAGMLVMPAMAQEETQLGKNMEAMNDAYKAFRKETDPAKGAASAREAQDYAIKGAMEVPEMVKAMTDEAAKAKATVEYRKMMGKLLVSLCEVEEAFLANDLAKVATLVDALKDQKKEGHDKFIEEE